MPCSRTSVTHRPGRHPRPAGARGLLIGFALCAWFLGRLAGCTPGREEGWQDDAGVSVPSRPDLLEPSLVGRLGCRGEPCDELRVCAPGSRCIDGACLPDEGSCQGDEDCAGDLRCLNGACIAYDACTQLPPFQPECREKAFPSDSFVTPAVNCVYREVNSLSLPIVADLDHDGRTEILTVDFGGDLVALHADDCGLLWRKKLALLGDGVSSIAVADLDADGFAEIVGLDADKRLLVIDRNGEVLATAAIPTQETNTYVAKLWTAPAIADLDGMAPPEIIAGAQVARFVKGPPARIEVLWTRENKTAFWGSVSIAADLDGDGRPEVITSDRIYDGMSGIDKTPRGLADKPFYAQVADFNLDHRPDLLLVESQKGGQVVRVYDVAAQRTLFGPYRAGEGGWGSPAVIADLDADGVPDFALGGATWLYAYSLKCAAEPRPPGCMGHEPGLLWAKPIDDRSSGSAAASAFDFNGDGAAEIVYRDECWLRIVSGFTGKTLAAYTITSSTGIELPVIADVDADGHADIVVTSDVDVDHFGYCPRPGKPESETGTRWSGWTRGVFVLSDPMKRWLPTRAVWNQHSYHVTNIRDDLTVPTPEPDSYAGRNSYRENLPLFMTPAPRPLSDLVGKMEPVRFPKDCSQPWPLRATVCNRGAGPALGPIPATFYDGPPDRGGHAVCTAVAATLLPGSCVAIECTWQMPPSAPGELYLRVGDDGKGARFAGQCRESNDLSVQRGLACFNAPD